MQIIHVRLELLDLIFKLWNTGRVPQRSSMRPNAGCGIWRGQMQLPARRCHIWVFLFLFLFFFDSRWLGFDSAKIGLYWPAAKTVETDQNGRNRSKSALNYAGTVEISSEWGPNILNLSFLNFILNICCFFCVCVCVFFFNVSCLLLSLFCESRT